MHRGAGRAQGSVSMRELGRGEVNAVTPAHGPEGFWGQPQLVRGNERLDKCEAVTHR